MTSEKLTRPEDTIPSQVRREGFAVLFLCAAVVASSLFVYWPMLFSGEPNWIAGVGDKHRQGGAFLFLLDAWLNAGELPLWNPYTLCGYPVAGHPGALTFYPPNLARSLLSPHETVLGMFYSLYVAAVFHQLVAALGIYGLARRGSLSIAASMVVALAVLYCVSWAGKIPEGNTIQYTLSWTPAILLALRESAWAPSVRRAVGWLLLGSLLYGLQLLAGFPQITVAATVGYVLFMGMQLAAKDPRGLASVSSLVNRTGRWIGSAALFGLLGACLAACALLPGRELLSHSVRSSETLADYVFPNRMPSPWGIVSWLYNRGERTGLEMVRHRGHILRDFYPFGVGLLIAIPAAIFSRKRSQLVIYGVLALLFFDWCAEPPWLIAKKLKKALPFGVSFAGYSTPIIALPLALIAGFGFDVITRNAWSRRKSLWFAGFLVVTGLALTLTMAEPPALGEWTVAWSLLPAAILALMLVNRGIPFGRTAVAGILLLEALVCARIDIVHVFTKSPEKGILASAQPFRRSLDYSTALPPEPIPSSRTMFRHTNAHLYSFRSTMNGYEPLLMERSFRALTNPGEENRYFRNPKISKNPAMLAFAKRRFWLADGFVDSPAMIKSRYVPPTRVAYLDGAPDLVLPERNLDDVRDSTIARPRTAVVLFDEKNPRTSRTRTERGYEFRSVAIPSRSAAVVVEYSSESAATMLLGTTPTRRYRAGPLELPVTGGKRSTFELPFPNLERANINVRITPADESNALQVHRITIVEDLNDESDRIEIVETTPNETSLRLHDLPGPRALVFAEAMYPGWRATLDGEPVPIHLANGMFMAVVVPSGTHEVQFEFQPRSVRTGLAVSAVALVVVLGGLLSCSVLSRRRRTKANP